MADLNQEPEHYGINNDIYHSLGQKWYEAKDDPVALLRAESRFLVDYVKSQLPAGPLKILDVGCGGGFFANPLAELGHDITGIDAATDALEVARQYDKTKSVKYREMNAYNMEFADESFDVILAMDFLEHVEPDRAIREMSRCLKPGGSFFFNTFSKNPLAWLICIKGVEWFVANTPKDMHVLELFISPKTLDKILAQHEIHSQEFRGMRPKLNKAFFRMLKTGCVDDDFEFTNSRSKAIGYCGHAKKKQSH